MLINIQDGKPDFFWLVLFICFGFFHSSKGCSSLQQNGIRKEKRITQIFLNTISVSRTDARNDYVTTYKQRFGSCKFTRSRKGNRDVISLGSVQYSGDVRRDRWAPRMWLKGKALAGKDIKLSSDPIVHIRWAWMHMPMTSCREDEDGQTPTVPWPGKSSWDEKF